MTGRGLDNSGDLADVFDGVFEEHEGHHGVVVIVLLEGVGHVVFQLLVGHEVVLTFTSDSVGEVTEDQVFGAGGLEVSLEVELGEGFLQEVEHDAFVLGEVLHGDETVTVDSFTLVDPELDDLVGSLELGGLGNQQALEHTGDVSQVELVMEVDSGLSEGLADVGMQSQSRLDESGHLFLHLGLEVLQVTLQEGVVDDEERFIIGHVDGNQPEMSLISGVHREGTGRRVHTGQMLTVDDLLDGQFSDVIPMLVIGVLSE